MAIAASILSHRFMRASRFTEALDAFFKKEDKKPAQNVSRLEHDLVELSPYNEIRQKISEFRQQKSIEAELTVKLTASTEIMENEEAVDSRLDRDIDLMLRMISKDDAEYKSLKARFQKMIKQAQKAYSAEAKAKAQNAESSSDQPMTANAMADAIVGNNTYEFELKFKKQRLTTSEDQTGISLEELGIKKADPLVLDIAQDGLNLTKAGEGALFDIDGDGKLDQTAWVKGDDALLVYDRNGNGIIDNGTELFGDQNGSINGFAELARYDKNSDGRIDNLDPIFKSLKLYQDMNGNGKIESHELKTLEQMGLKSLNLNFYRTNQDMNGNSLILNGSFEKNDGTTGLLADVLLGYRKIP
ncbi:MAG: hypothetical protein Kow0029_29990 [Candidatus Rifleibacteriota bacterium]